MLNEDIIKSYIPEIKKFHSHSNNEVKNFSIELTRSINNLLERNITKEEFNDGNTLGIPTSNEVSEEEILARKSLNYIKERVLEFYVSG